MSGFVHDDYLSPANLCAHLYFVLYVPAKVTLLDAFVFMSVGGVNSETYFLLCVSDAVQFACLPSSRLLWDILRTLPLFTFSDFSKSADW